MRKRVQKIVAKQAFEAVKEVMNYYQEWSMRRDASNPDGKDNLLRDYPKVRRLRDYLRNLVRNHAEPVLHLGDEDANLLVSCCLFAIENLRVYLRTQQVGLDESRWLRETEQNLISLCLEAATTPAVVITGPERRMPHEIRDVIQAIDQRLGAPPPAGGGILKGGAAAMQGMFSGEPAKGPVVAPPAPAADSASAALPGDSGGTELPGEPRVSDEFLPLDPTMIKDPRLRSMVRMDLATLQHAVRLTDHRLSAVVLAALFEAVVVDLAMRRRVELELRGTPDSWNLQQVAVSLLDGNCTGPDRNTLFHLLTCRNLVRPAVQLSNPVVVTGESFGKMRTFFLGFLAETGLCSPDEAVRG
jgi:hypothetical protein